MRKGRSWVPASRFFLSWVWLLWHRRRTLIRPSIPTVQWLAFYVPLAERSRTASPRSHALWSSASADGTVPTVRQTERDGTGQLLTARPTHQCHGDHRSDPKANCPTLGYRAGPSADPTCTGAWDLCWALWATDFPKPPLIFCKHEGCL